MSGPRDRSRSLPARWLPAWPQKIRVAAPAKGLVSTFACFAPRSESWLINEVRRMVSSARASIAHLHDPQSMLYPLLRPLLFALDPETAHDTVFASLDAAAACGVAKLVAPRVRSSPVEVMGLTFPNRVGLAAGLDKNAAHID